MTENPRFRPEGPYWLPGKDKAISSHVAQVTRSEYLTRDGAKIQATVIHVPPSADFALMIDPRFEQRRIALDNQRLISQAGTRAAWNGEVVGRRPEDFLEDGSVPHALAFPPTNAGWQTEAFWIKRDEPVLIPNDRERLTGTFDVIGFKGTRLLGAQWVTESVTFADGRLDKQSEEAVKGMGVGFSMPLMIKDGKVVPLGEYLGDPRVLADARNVFNFANGAQVPEDFWRLIRPFLAETKASVTRVGSERSSVVTSAEVSPEDSRRLADIIEEYDMEQTFRIRRSPHKPERAQLLINGKLPLNRIPLVGLGHNTQGELVVVAIDGRQKESDGATLEEAAQIMKDAGIVNGGLGSAGGDVVVVDNDGKLLNSPSTVDQSTGQRVSRPVPAILVIK